MELNGSAETKKEAEPPINIFKRIRNLINFFTVEPFLLCYILPSIISSVAVQKLNLEKACRSDLNFTEEICFNIVTGVEDADNITTEASNNAQILVAEMTAWQQPLQTGIPAIMVLFVGAWSDRTGNRKALMLIPVVGELISSVGLILATHFFLEWPLWATALIESLPTAFSGGISIVLMGCYSYIADVTTLETRTFRMGIAGVIVTLGIPLGTSISGVLTTAVGYYGIFGIGIGIYLFAFFYTLFRIHDIRSTETVGTFKEKFILFFHPRNVWDTLSLVVTTRGRRFIQIILVICAHIVIIGPVFAEGAVLFLYTLSKYSMDIIDFSLFQTYNILMGLCGTTIAVTVFSKLLKMHDAMLGIIGTACKVMSSFLYGLAPTRQWFYSGPAFDFFGGSAVTAIRSLGTKVVEPNQVAKMCSLIALVEAIAPALYTPIYSKLYAATITTFPGAFYLLGGIMTIPAFFIFIILYYMHKKQERDVVKNPAEKEMHAHENDITAL